MKKVLIVTYYWPPAGGPGVQRVLNIVESLPDLGWDPIVLTVKNPSAPASDMSLMSRISRRCKVYKTKTREPFEAYKRFTGKKPGSDLPKNISLNKKMSITEKLSRWIRANLFVPDARKGWVRYIVRDGMRVIRYEKPDIIFSTSPPHSLQLGAMKLAEKSGLPWVADLRDPWTEAYWESQMPKTRYSQKKNQRLEEQVLKSANLITTVGKGIRNLFKLKTNTPISVIYNGYREIYNSPIPSRNFEIIHLGNLSSMQSCHELFEAVNQMDLKYKRKIKLVFIGTLAEEHRRELETLTEVHYELIDFLPYKEMIERARQASLLYLPRLNSSYSKSLVSAKLFDYLALMRPILALADRNSDIAAILKDSKSGVSFASGELEKIKEFIERSVDEPFEFSPFHSSYLPYSTKENMSALVRKFNQLTR
jgi:glycosyltransferase involved in cell wall biosynthesis